jgi:hypothetical protein
VRLLLNSGARFFPFPREGIETELLFDALCPNCPERKFEGILFFLLLLFPPPLVLPDGNWEDYCEQLYKLALKQPGFFYRDKGCPWTQKISKTFPYIFVPPFIITNDDLPEGQKRTKGAKGQKGTKRDKNRTNKVVKSKIVFGDPEGDIWRNAAHGTFSLILFPNLILPSSSSHDEILISLSHGC